jgi:hypothetical protein
MVLCRLRPSTLSAQGGRWSAGRGLATETMSDEAGSGPLTRGVTMTGPFSPETHTTVQRPRIITLATTFTTHRLKTGDRRTTTPTSRGGTTDTRKRHRTQLTAGSALERGQTTSPARRTHGKLITTTRERVVTNALGGRTNRSRGHRRHDTPLDVVPEAGHLPKRGPGSFIRTADDDPCPPATYEASSPPAMSCLSPIQ